MPTRAYLCPSAGLAAQLEARLGLRGLVLQLFDEDFTEWCSPMSLDEVFPAAGTGDNPKHFSYS